MNKIIKITEKDLVRIVERVLNESGHLEGAEMPEKPTSEYLDYVASLEKDNESDNNQQQVAEYWNRQRINRKKYFR